MEQDLMVMISLLAQLVVNKTTHQDYERVTMLADMYRKFVTGIDLDELMEQFVSRESDEAFKQRKTLTQHIIPSVVSNITSVERKVPRSNGKTRVIAYKEDANYSKAKNLEKALSAYWGTQSLDDWMAVRWLELNDLDPNTFVVVEWDKVDSAKQKVQPRPYEVSSENAVMFEFYNNVLLYLLDKSSQQVTGWDDKDVAGEKYTMYLMNQTIQAVQVFDKEVLNKVTEDGMLFNLGDEKKPDYYFRRNEKELFHVVTFTAHNLGMVPAFRAGYKRDEGTDGRTFVSPYHDAVPYLKKTLKANSELDLTMALHAFPQKIVTANRCTNMKCNDGWVKDGDNTYQCGTCKGTGFMVHSSTQDILYVPLPRDQADQLSLDNMARYITPEVALVEFQRSYIEYLTEECMQAVFNSDIFTKEQVATTATEKRIDLDNVYDTLFPLSVKFSRAWEFQVEIIAKVRGEQKDLIASLTFSKDFKFKSKDDYIADRRAALDAGAPDIVLRHIDDEIVKIDTSEDPTEYIMYKVQQSFDPFSGKTDEKIATLMVSNTVPFETKVFYANMGWIFDEVAMKTKDFYQKNRTQQASLLKKKTDELVKQLKANNTQPPDLNAGQ